MVTQGDNDASKKSIGNGPKIHLCGAIPNKLKHGGFGHRPSPWEFLVLFVCLSFVCPLVTPRMVSWFALFFALERPYPSVVFRVSNPSSSSPNPLDA